jgi:hypothetical protein
VIRVNKSTFRFGSAPKICQVNSSQERIADSSSTKAVQLFIRTHNETLTVAAMRVYDPDCSPVGIKG